MQFLHVLAKTIYEILCKIFDLLSSNLLVLCEDPCLWRPKSPFSVLITFYRLTIYLLILSTVLQKFHKSHTFAELMNEIMKLFFILLVIKDVFPIYKLQLHKSNLLMSLYLTQILKQVYANHLKILDALHFLLNPKLAKFTNYLSFWYRYFRYIYFYVRIIFYCHCHTSGLFLYFHST